MRDVQVGDRSEWKSRPPGEETCHENGDTARHLRRHAADRDRVRAGAARHRGGPGGRQGSGGHRQGISVISAKKLLIEDCTFQKTDGTAPRAGIDFEPNGPDESLTDCVVRNCTFRENAGYGMLFALHNIGKDPVSIRVEGCTCERNREGPLWVLAPTAEGRVEFLGNRFSGTRKLEHGPGLKVEFGPAPRKDDPPRATGTLDGKPLTFPADGVPAAVGLLESCHDESLYSAAERMKAEQGDHIRVVFPSPITVTVMEKKLEVSELVFRRPLNTGVFWVRAGDTWRRYAKYEFPKEKAFEAWLRQGKPAD